MVNFFKSFLQKKRRKDAETELEEAYRKLDIEVYRGLSPDKYLEGKICLYDEDEEFLCIVSKATDFKIITHQVGKIFYGFNLYVRPNNKTDLLFVGTYNTKKTASKVIKQIHDSIELGASRFYAPENY